jgi:hypothetical protein
VMSWTQLPSSPHTRDSWKEAVESPT